MYTANAMSKPVALAFLPLLLMPGLSWGQPTLPSTETRSQAGGEHDPSRAPPHQSVSTTPASSPQQSDIALGSDVDNPPPQTEAPLGNHNRDKKPFRSATKHYPLRFIDRPLNLFRGMSEMVLGADVGADPWSIGGRVYGYYGITDQVQIGLKYGLGTFSEGTLSTGKAVEVEAQYLVNPRLAATISVPVYVDPLAVGLVFGVPIRYNFLDNWSLFVGREFLSFRLHQFQPSLRDARRNDVNIAKIQVRTIIPLWIAKTSVIAAYQYSDKLTFHTEFGVTFDNSDRANTTLLNAGLLLANTNRFDLGAEIGAYSLSEFSETLNLNLFVKLRI